MTKDEAIEKVIAAFSVWEAEYYTGDDWSEEHETLDMAIEALATEYKEQIRCEDCAYCRTFYHGVNMPLSYRCEKLYLCSDLSSDDYCSRAKRKE